MYQYHCLNPISQIGLDKFTENYQKTEAAEAADAILVRSASMHEMELPENLKVVARAGAGVNNIPLDRCAEKGIVVFNTPGANANGVKELVIAGMLLAARDIIGVRRRRRYRKNHRKEEESFCRNGAGRKKNRSDRSGSDRSSGGECSDTSGNGSIWI